MKITLSLDEGGQGSHSVEIVNVNSEECKVLMREFIRQNPELWNEDIGK